MSGPSRTLAKARPGPIGPQPPRPPNAWILYRSDKLREIMATRDPKGPKKPQADISRDISELWKQEDPAVRAEYERIAELRKQEHQLMYPGYKFQPVKREEKVRRREEEKREKERVKEEMRKNKVKNLHVPWTAIAGPSSAPKHLPPQQAPYTYGRASTYPYAPLGPSPPLSCASSPLSSPSPLSIDAELPTDSAPMPTYDPTMPPPPLPDRDLKMPLTPPDSDSSHSGSSTQPMQLPTADAHATPAPAPAIVVSPAESAPAPEPAPPQAPQQDVAMDVSGESSASVFNTQFGYSGPGPDPFEGVQIDSNMLSFDMPLSDIAALDWLSSMSAGAPTSAGASANAIVDGTSSIPGVFSLAPVDTFEFNIFPPPGSVNIDFEMGFVGPSGLGAGVGVGLSQRDVGRDELFAQFLSELDFSTLPGGPMYGALEGPSTDDRGAEGMGMDLDMGDGMGMGMQETPRSVTQNDLMQQWFNLSQFADSENGENAGVCEPVSMDMAPTPMSVSAPAPVSTGANGYVPPSGAVNHAKRRVAGSWRPASPATPTPTAV